MSDELQELHEHAHEAHRDPSLAPVTISMALLAVLVAVASLLGHRTHTEELLAQSKATDQWAYYQAKNIRRHSYELFLDMLAVIDSRDVEAKEKVKAKYEKEINKSQYDLTDIQSEAKGMEGETGLLSRKADRFDLGEVMLEVALVITSITLLTHKRVFWLIGLAISGAGVLIAATGFFL